MGRLSILEETNVPATPTEGNTLYSTVATPSLFRLKDDAGNVYTFALLEKAQTYTVLQTIAPVSTSQNGIDISMPASTTGFALRAVYNAVNAFIVEVRAAISQITVSSRDLGNNVAGPALQVQRNTNAGTEGPAAGTLSSVRAAGGARFIWPDAANDWRTHTAAPTGSSGSPTVADNSGVAIGSQTSWYALKENIQERKDPATLLALVLQAKLYDYQMQEDGHQYVDGSKPTYTGLVITEEDRRNDAWFAKNLGPHQTPVLNERNLFGHLIGSVQAQQTQIEELRKEIAELKARI